MLDTGPVTLETESGAVVFNVTHFTGFPGLFAETWSGRLGMLDSRPMTDFALYVFQSWSIKFADKTARLVKTHRVADKTFRVKRLVDLDQGLICPSMAGLAPGFVFAGMTAGTDLIRRKNPGFIFFSLGRQRGEKQLLYFFIIFTI